MECNGKEFTSNGLQDDIFLSIIPTSGVEWGSSYFYMNYTPTQNSVERGNIKTEQHEEKEK
jgi:hypothetical protein